MGCCMLFKNVKDKVLQLYSPHRLILDRERRKKENLLKRHYKANKTEVSGFESVSRELSFDLYGTESS